MLWLQKKSPIRLLLLIIIGFVVVLLGNFLIIRVWQSDNHKFSQITIAIADYNLNDLGVADINRDGKLDIFTTNHSAQQSISFGDGTGKFEDRISDLELSQDRQFAYLENSDSTPVKNKPGLYIYRQNNLLHFVAHQIQPSEIFSGTLSLSSSVEIVRQIATEVSLDAKQLSSGGTTTKVKFTLKPEAHLVLKSFVEIPHTIQLKPEVALQSVYLGRQSLNPNSNTFNLMWRDRHSMAWTDLNQDGKLDVFIGRGGIKGKMHQFPETFYDELFINRGSRFEDIVKDAKLTKNNCPGRQAAWIDYDRDGWLDLYHACGRGSSDSIAYPNQLFHQVSQGVFIDVAPELNLDLPGNGEFLWLDADRDGDLDLIATQEKDLALYVNQQDRFIKQPLGELADSSTKKFSVVDYNLDGMLDVYISGKKQNFLLSKTTNSYQLIDPSTIGLPKEGLCGNWIDYNNDGLPDLYTVPGGIYRQNTNGSFKQVNTLARNAEIVGASSSPIWGWNRTKLRDVRCSWFDFDNDGNRDAVISSENIPSFRERMFRKLRSQKSIIQWKTELLHNAGFGNHWLEIVLQGTKNNPQAIGTTVKVTTPTGIQMQQIGSSEGSYFSQGHYRFYFGLGKYKTIDLLEVHWDNGDKTTLKQVPGDRILVVKTKQQTA